MQSPIFVVLAVLCNVAAQILIKIAGKNGAGGTSLIGWISPWLACAVILYGLSFLLTVRVFAMNTLSTVSPIMAGSTFLLIAFASSFLFGEGLSSYKIGGIAAITLGIFLLSRS